MYTYGVDWSGKHIHVSEDGVLHHVYKLDDMEALRQKLVDRGLPVRVVVESTLHSYDPDKRDQTIIDYRDSGIDLRMISPRMTGWWRVARNLDKSDALDAVAIYHIGNDPRIHLKVPTLRADQDPEWERTRKEAAREIMVLRREGRKDAFAEAVAAQLPRLKDQPRIRQWALGGKNYNLVTVAAVGVIASYVQNMDEFERLAGLYGNGKNSQFRSDLYFHAWRSKLEKEPILGQVTAKGRPKTRTKIGPNGRPVAKPIALDDGQVVVPTLSDFRRELRWLYRQVAQVDLSV